MNETKFGKYFFDDTPPNPLHPESRELQSQMPWVNPISINEEGWGKAKNAFWLEPNIVVRPGADNNVVGKPHAHDFDEYLLFMGFDPNNQHDLGGEVELWIEDEMHIITKTTAVFVPRHTYHCPLVMRKVDRPFGFIAMANTPRYAHYDFSPDPKYKDALTHFDEEAIVRFSDGSEYKVTKTYMQYLEWMREKNRKEIER